jgi:hypothetical protein
VTECRGKTKNKLVEDINEREIYDVNHVFMGQISKKNKIIKKQINLEN